MPDMDDFHAFRSTGGGGSGAGGAGCPAGCLLWILAGMAILGIVGRLAA